MAKGQKTSKKKGGQKQNRKVRGFATNPSRDRQYMQLLNDPCNADYVDGAVYPGETGIVTRFAIDGNAGTGAGNTSGALIFHPNDNTFNIVTQDSPGTTFTLNAGNFITNNAPGTAFLHGSAAKARGLAACISALPNSTVFEAKGDIAVGNVSLETLYSTATSVNAIFSLLTVKGPVVRKNYEAKWVPGLMDSRYSQVLPGSNPSTTGTDQSDTNCVVIAWRSLAPASGLSYRVTLVAEWTPKLGAGMTTSSTSEPGLNTLGVVHAMHKSKPNWWHNLMDGIGSDLGGAARYLSQRAISNGVSSVLSAAPLMLM